MKTPEASIHAPAVASFTPWAIQEDVALATTEASGAAVPDDAPPPAVLDAAPVVAGGAVSCPAVTSHQLFLGSATPPC